MRRRRELPLLLCGDYQITTGQLMLDCDAVLPFKEKQIDHIWHLIIKYKPWTSIEVALAWSHVILIFFVYYDLCFIFLVKTMSTFVPDKNIIGEKQNGRLNIIVYFMVQFRINARFSGYKKHFIFFWLLCLVDNKCNYKT